MRTLAEDMRAETWAFAMVMNERTTANWAHDCFLWRNEPLQYTIFTLLIYSWFGFLFGSAFFSVRASVSLYSRKLFRPSVPFARSASRSAARSADGEKSSAVLPLVSTAAHPYSDRQVQLWALLVSFSPVREMQVQPIAGPANSLL